MNCVIVLSYCVFVCCVVLLSVSAEEPQKNRQILQKEILDKIINSSYDTSIRPLGINASQGIGDEDEPCVVDMNLYIMYISKIDDHDMEYSLQLVMTHKWFDNRLVFDDYNGTVKYVALRDTKKIWTPDLFFNNEKEGKFHEIMTLNNLVRIFPNGTVLYAARVSETLSCPMDLQYFPFDIQKCNIRMASYSYNTENLIFKWSKINPVQLPDPLFLPRFKLKSYIANKCPRVVKTETGIYSCLNVDLEFEREYGYYAVQFFAPCALLVTISWMHFWLDIPIDAKVSLVVTTLITLALLIVGINTTLPEVSYIKAIDVWTGGCLLFVFAAVAQFAITTYASDEHNEDDVKKECVANDESANWLNKYLAQYKSSSERIDLVSRILFPLSFVVFAVVFWIVYI